MNNITKYSVMYYYKKINYKIVAILALALILFNIYAVYEMNNNVYNFGDGSILQKNGWDLYCQLYVNSSIAANGLIFFSLYFIFNCFPNEKNEYFLKIRSNNSFRWFISKIISIFSFNLIVSIGATLITLIIGMIAFGSSFKWSSLAEVQAFSKFYSPISFAVLNALTYSFFVTFLAEIIGVLIIKFKNKIVIGSFVVIYLIVNMRIFSFSEKIVKVGKYFSLYAYTRFGCRTYYKGDIMLNYFTVKESLVCSIILFVLMTILIRIIYKIAKVRR